MLSLPKAREIGRRYSDHNDPFNYPLLNLYSTLRSKLMFLCQLKGGSINDALKYLYSILAYDETKIQQELVANYSTSKLDGCTNAPSLTNDYSIMSKIEVMIIMIMII